MRAHPEPIGSGGNGHARSNGTGHASNGHGHPNGNGHAGTNADHTYLGACAKHFAARAVGQCDDCGEVWCSQCLVPTTRKRQPTRCIDCALVAAGVRAPGPRRSGMATVSRYQRRPTSLF